MTKIGIIGLSEGNGHPYSWSAIFNGYEQEMENNGFPVIYNYLSARNLPAETIKGAKVTHVWTEDYSLSCDIATAAKIDNPVKTLEELLDAVDLILFARDDCQGRKKFLMQAIESGKPIFIDKPIEINVQDLESLIESEKYPGQIFSCSSFRYSHHLKSLEREVGNIILVNAYIPKSWEKYSVHLIDPVVFHFLENAKMKNSSVFKNKETVQVSSNWSNGVIFNCTTLGSMSVMPKIEIIGEKGRGEVFFDDAFSTFKASLESFIEFASNKDESDKAQVWRHHRKVVSVIAKGMIDE